MTVQLQLPKDIEDRLLEEVRKGRHASIESAILEKLSQPDETEILAGLGMSGAQIRQDLDDAWNNRDGKVNGTAFFDQLRSRATHT